MKHSKKRSISNQRQIEGRNPVLEALRAGTQVVKIVFEEKMKADERISEIRELAQKKKIRVDRLKRKVLDNISRTKTHQGVIGWAEEMEESSVRQILEVARKENREPFFIILPDVTYEQNLGAVVRTAEAGGVDAVIVSHRASQITPLVSRMSMGATEYLPLIHENIFSVLRLFRDEGIKVAAADLAAEKTLFQSDLSGPIALLIGNEHKGISQTLCQRIDLKVKIPMLGKIDSLNLSVAAGILIYEVVRQRQFLM